MGTLKSTTITKRTKKRADVPPTPDDLPVYTASDYKRIIHTLCPPILFVSMVKGIVERAIAGDKDSINWLTKQLIENPYSMREALLSDDKPAVDDAYLRGLRNMALELTAEDLDESELDD